ncbi:MAG: helix-turn-helix domain-containing protein [Candidatus Paceibacterota bacterium]|jgi:hypothetical protein
MEIKSLREIIKGGIKAKGITPQKLTELTDIAPIYIKSLLEGNLENMPALPYVRGYMEKIADVLDLDFREIWEQYRKETEIKKSGEKDLLPNNRYATKPINKKSIFWIVLVLVVVSLLIPQISSFLGSPYIEVTSPKENNIIVEQNTYLLRGKVSNSRDKVTIGDEEIVVFPDGTFEKEVLLNDKINTFEFRAKRFLGKTSLVSRIIIYQPLEITPIL